MTKFAAYDNNSIYGVGSTEEEAIMDARKQVKDDEAEFETARISDALFAQIERDGWDGMSQSFDVCGGEITETTAK